MQNYCHISPRGASALLLHVCMIIPKRRKVKLLGQLQLATASATGTVITAQLPIPSFLITNWLSLLVGGGDSWLNCARR